MIIAFYGGAPRNPPWYHDLAANPVVAVEIGTEKLSACLRSLAKSSNGFPCAPMHFSRMFPCTTCGQSICHARGGITLAEFLRRAGDLFHRPPPAVRALLSVRFFVGGLFGWDLTTSDPVSESFARGLTDEDRARSLAPAGTPDGLFRIVYRFENEQLNEIINRTPHAGALSALVEASAGYRFYFAVYVREVSPFTPFYMAAIDPLRKVIVYPALLRRVAAQWNATFGQDKGTFV